MDYSGLYEKAYGLRLMVFIMGRSQVIANLVETDVDGWIVKNPIILAPVKEGIAVGPYCPNAEEGQEILLLKNAVQAVYAARPKELQELYLKATTGIEVTSEMPKGPILVKG